jgi:hypothetical protein
MNEIHWQQLIPPDADFRVSMQDYELFLRDFTMYAVAGKRFGQAFCEHFGIMSMLYHLQDQKISERWIRDNYLESNEAKVC